MDDPAPTPDPVDDLSPEHAEVRRLLADARHEEPMPDGVAARLDRVLAGLAEEPTGTAPVADLALRRRRAASLLLAAAAVVAIGVGVGQVVDTGTGSADSLATADRDESGPEAGAAEDGAGAQEESPEGAAEAPGFPAEGSGEDQATTDRSGLARLTRRQYGDQVADLQAGGSLGELGTAGPAPSAASSAAGAACRADTWGAGTFVPVRYEGLPAVLVLRRARGDTQVADLFLCGDTEPHRSTTLPAP